ncbi:TetR/AcrR family transcriptional regulator [Methanobacterium spitsbergense]|uniref:TetR/AcrR family transcriptional regulator n=1 Tax=Methanobacterium spitsbergense TaxID=2874285 RepID=A0A8T5UQC7_9EURY|nr:TetR/AcrR family transcriptional regulator [Methanobacterium spitsbergense]MBZ2165864.1 TetR/AcrR family transcriptional regulator [Methanobacterium spitsbergense]
MAMADRREREKKKRQHDIINAAEKLFFSKGYDKVSMNDIALAVELSKATLYLYFENKESLFFAIVLRGTKILNSMILEQVENEYNGMDKMSAYRNAYYKFTKQYPDYIQIYNYFQSGRFNLANQEKTNKKPKPAMNSIPYVNECANEINRLRKERFSILCNSIQKGIEDGTIRPDLDPVEVAVLLSAISKNLSHIPPDHEKALENRGISHEDYFKDVGLFIRHMIINRTD